MKLNKSAEDRWIFGTQFFTLQLQYLNQILENPAEIVTPFIHSPDNWSQDLNTYPFCLF
jgi:hypothetical protein